MATLALPIEQSTPWQRFFMPLEGTAYLFEVRWNERDAAWYMDIYTEQEEPLMLGLKLVLGAVVGRTYVQDGLPPGKFFCADTEGNGTEAGIDDLGARVRVYYVESDG